MAAIINLATTNTLLVHDRWREPRVLSETFSALQRVLKETQDVRLLPFENQEPAPRNGRRPQVEALSTC